MAGSNGATNGWPTGDELTKQSQIGTIKRNPPPPKADDVIAGAVEASKSRLALNMLNRENAQLEADAIEAETRRIKAQAELIQARTDAKPEAQQQQPNQLTEFLFAQLQEVKGLYTQADAQARQAEKEKLEERMEFLAAKLQEQSHQQIVPAERSDLDGLERVAEIFAKVEEFKARITPPPPPPPEPQLAYDPGLEKWRLTIEDQREQRRLEFERERWVLQQKLELEREVTMREIARADRDSEVHNAFWQKTAPGIGDIVTRVGMGLLSRWGMGASPAEAAAAQVEQVGAARAAVDPGPQSGAQPEPVSPPGVLLHQCACGFMIPYKQGYTRIMCPRCFNEYGEDPPPATQEATTDVPSDRPGVETEQPA